MREVTLRIPDDVQAWFARKAPETAKALVLDAKQMDLTDVMGLGDSICLLIVSVRPAKVGDVPVSDIDEALRRRVASS